MFLQTSMTSRRKFLERSALGFGSLAFSSMLLESCIKDHNIPDPNGPGNQPPLGLEFDWNDNAKILARAAVEHIPMAGAFLSPILDILWPESKEDIWGEIKEKVEALVDQKIADSVYQHVSEDLDGLKSAIILYVHEANTYDNAVAAYQKDSSLPEPDPTDLRVQWMMTRTVFVTALPHFQSSGYELLLLPFFTQFTNMYLSLLRDGVANGVSWGRDKDHAQDVADLKAAIDVHYKYAIDTYNNGRDHLQATTKADSNLCQPFRTLNQYDRQLTLSVLDFTDLWWAYDSSQFPPKEGEPAMHFYSREVFSDPYGSCDNSGDIALVTPHATQFPTNLTVWGYDRIDAVQLTYPANSGPGKNVTTTPRMGDQGGGTNQSPHGGSFNLSPVNPITHARVIYSTYQYWTNEIYGPFPARLQFGYSDGTSTDLMGGTNGTIKQNDSGWISFPSRAMSSVHINGVNNRINSADAVVFGFQPWIPLSEILKAASNLYIKSPEERSTADLAKSFSKHAIPDNLITEELKVARKSYWEKLKARAHELK